MGKYIDRSRIDELLGTPAAPGVEIEFGPITTAFRDNFECSVRREISIHCDPDVLLLTARKNEELMKTLSEIREKIDNGELAEVRHGRWVSKSVLRWDYEQKRTVRISELRCSECNTQNHRKRKFCPECGARMDGDTDA